jgi:hypothetical protein
MKGATLKDHTKKCFSAPQKIHEPDLTGYDRCDERVG